MYAIRSYYGTRAERGVRLELDADLSEARRRVDHGSEQPHPAMEGFGNSREIDGCRLTDLHAREVLLRDLTTHLDLATARETEQRLATRDGVLAHLGIACEDQTV